MLSVRKKLQGQGGSLLVVLPKIWTDAKGLKQHDEVQVLLNDSLTITPVKQKEQAHAQ